jgi:hypothetical protein
MRPCGPITPSTTEHQSAWHRELEEAIILGQTYKFPISSLIVTHKLVSGHRVRNRLREWEFPSLAKIGQGGVAAP